MKVHDSVAFSFPGSLDSPNQWTWRPWFVYARIKKTWKKRVMLAFLQNATARRSAPANCFAQVRISCYRHRLLDVDNLYGSVKPLLDGLKVTKLIADDDPASIDLKVEQFAILRSAPQFTHVQIIYSRIEAKDFAGSGE